MDVRTGSQYHRQQSISAFNHRHQMRIAREREKNQFIIRCQHARIVVAVISLTDSPRFIVVIHAAITRIAVILFLSRIRYSLGRVVTVVYRVPSWSKRTSAHVIKIENKRLYDSRNSSKNKTLRDFLGRTFLSAYRAARGQQLCFYRTDNGFFVHSHA